MASQTLTEGKLAYTFPAGWDSSKFDEWAFYRNQFQNAFCGNKAVDFLAYDPTPKTLWLIELKDYRQFRRTKDEKISLWDEVAIKVRDTLSCLVAAGADTGHNQHGFADNGRKAKKLRVVLHLEQPRNHSKLFPRVFDPANVKQKLKSLVKPVDAHPVVIELNNMAGVPWSAASN